MCYAPMSSTTLDPGELPPGTARLWFRHDHPVTETNRLFERTAGTETNRLFERTPSTETNRLFERRPPRPGTAMRLWRHHRAPETGRLFERSGVATR